MDNTSYMTHSIFFVWSVFF